MSEQVDIAVALGRGPKYLVRAPLVGPGKVCQKIRGKVSKLVGDLRLHQRRAFNQYTADRFAHLGLVRMLRSLESKNDWCGLPHAGEGDYRPVCGLRLSGDVKNLKEWACRGKSPALVSQCYKGHTRNLGQGLRDNPRQSSWPIAEQVRRPVEPKPLRAQGPGAMQRVRTESTLRGTEGRSCQTCSRPPGLAPPGLGKLLQRENERSRARARRHIAVHGRPVAASSARWQGARRR